MQSDRPRLVRIHFALLTLHFTFCIPSRPSPMPNLDQKPARPLSRRIFLRGAGVVMALPWLESLPVWGAPAEALKAPRAFPQRFVVQFMGNGIHADHWG